MLESGNTDLFAFPATTPYQRMKYCPTCETRYDEDILRFCMKDGTPLIDESEPQFVTMPSEDLPPAEDEADEVTVIRRNQSPPATPVMPAAAPDDDVRRSSQRIVVPTYEEPQRTYAQPVQPPPRSNTWKVVVLTILGTLAVVAVAAAGLWMLQREREPAANANANAGNANTNLNTNLNLDNFNFNANSDLGTNTNANANLKTPTPSPTPTPTPKPSPSLTPTASPTPDDDDMPAANTRPSTTPTPLPRISPSPTDRPVNGGVLNGRAISLPVPTYPPIARRVGAEGQVSVQVLVDERGNVISAKAVSGHPLLRSAAELAARQSKISPARIGEQNVKTTGVIVYNFRNN